jgi:hypothetical protein
MSPTGTFIKQISDAPDSYEGQSGKVVSVNTTEDGLEFTAGGGGGGVASLSLSSSGNSNDVIAHPYTADNCGLIVKDANNVEVFRLWASDPNLMNYNVANLYIGYQAGLAQPHDQTSAGYFNTGIGYLALAAITQGTDNVAVGYQAICVLTTGAHNTFVGSQAGGGKLGSNGITTGNFNTVVGSQAMPESAAGTDEGNVAVGYRAGELASGDSYCVYLGMQSGGSDGTSKTNSIAIGKSASVSVSNRAVIGNVSVADVFFGSETAASKLHGKGDAIVFPDSDPHVAGAAYWVGGVLTKSAG